MSTWTFILRSLAHYQRIHLAVALGVMAATAVLTGALLVGDSVRGSLRHLAFDRLGRIDDVLITDRFFREALSSELAAAAGFSRDFASATPAILLPGGTVERTGTGAKARASNVLILGSDDRFWQLGNPSHRPKRSPGDGEIVLNEPLAVELGVQVGDELVLRLPRSNQVPADSPLGKKEDRIQTLAGLKVIEIVPAESLGRFELRASQRPPHNAYVSLTALQNALEQPDKVNALLVAEKASIPAADSAEKLKAMLRPTFEDYGFAVQHVRTTFREKGSDAEQVAFEYLHFTSDRMVIEPAADLIASKVFEAWNAQPVLTYLAVGIEKVAGEKSDGARPVIPYSTITAIDSVAGLGPLVDDQGKPLPPLGEQEIVLNQWAADDLNAKIGDKIRVSFFEPETTHGQAVERSAEFTLRAIAPLVEPAEGFRRRRPRRFEERPTLANDSDLTPTVEGITDQDSIDDWDPPFPFEQKRVRDQDDVYWQNHRTTPKAFLSLATGRRLWGSRFGQTTSYRIPIRGDVSSDAIKERFIDEVRKEGATLGFDFIPVKRRGLDASSGTTPFDGLFLGLSFFIIAAALLLVALLFRMGIEQRAAELGVLLAVGLKQRLAAGMLMREGVVVAALGGVLGVAAGVGYAWLMLAGLRTWWLGAIVTPFLNLYVTPKSLLLGYFSGLVTSAAMIWWTIRRTRHVAVRRLLNGELSEDQSLVTTRRRRWPAITAYVLFFFAIVLTVAATRLTAEAQAGCFVGSGMMLLLALLLEIWRRFAEGPRSGSNAAIRLASLAARNAGRNPSRSTLTIGLMAIASFLIIALSAFRLDPSVSGTGGFDLVAESSQPIFLDLNRPEVQADVFGPKATSFDGNKIFGLRLKPGDDASCNNLYQATQPRVIGVTQEFISHFDWPAKKEKYRTAQFQWAGTATGSDLERANPWRLLRGPREDDSPIPVVLDKNTAMYSLHLYGGVGQKFSVTYEDGTTLQFRVAGLLSNSVLQGSLLISESDFVRAFPKLSGYRYFLIDSGTGPSELFARALEDKLGDQGFDAMSSTEILSNLLAVQNTYLSTFQSLGALGLLLGTFGLATVQLRNVFERRKELALLRAAGFRRQRLARMVLLEHLVLLIGGLGVGVLAALVAIIPHLLFGGASVPWVDLAKMLVVVLVVGLVSGFAAVRATLRAPLIGSLRGD